MRFKFSVLSIWIGLLIFFVGNGSIDLNAQQQGGDMEKAAQTAETPKKKVDGLVIDWLNDFESCEDWRADSTCPLGETKIRKIPGKPRPVNDRGQFVNENGEPGEFANELTDENGISHKNEYVIGVKSYFLERGYDRVEVFPPNEYIVRGKAREIKVWVLGRKFRHTLYVKLRDFRGHLHKLKIGPLDFWGWKELSVIIPGWLPQSASYAVLDKNLHFVSFFVESDRYEVPGTFYFYLDQFRVITDLSEFTGDESIKDTW
ncbi:MAG TPA: flagellar filament outer layer protein FlaA [Spirochaetota bacterium]|nr:flagellar filament outer layer protein FlaA [Spirochaetota bacterium]HSA15008.1 flagellar filament outer layer protein FlaA [Spirochaetota bacterium]